jgi:hypothetical protein
MTKRAGSEKKEVRDFYFAKSASQPVTASKTPESVSYCFVRTKSGDKSQSDCRKAQKSIITHDGTRRIKSAKDARKLCDVVDARSGDKEQPDKGDYQSLSGR